ncbi:MAG: hypothetical protein K8I27_00155 [Planctomycetes bacterium]|nr:hypothetical protein [Planctomycetota bacterium]
MARRDARLDPDRLVFIDETWVKTNMTRRYGRAAAGERLVDHVPFGHWLTTTFIAALRADRLEDSFPATECRNYFRHCGYSEHEL